MFTKGRKRKFWLISRLTVLLMFVAAFAAQAEQKEGVKANNLLQDEPITVTGKVTDFTGAPLPGVNVYNKADNLQGTITDFDGNYTLQLNDPNAILIFSFMGFQTKEVPVKGQTKIDVILAEETRQLEDVVVVGYGVQKKENVTGSVATVEPERLEQRPVQTVAGALAGTMPGVTSIQSSGEPGQQRGTITIRGKNSLSGGSPLVIVDGIPATMENLDMNDIESISVLKDAASAAIYGVTAANGVILITTKRGKKEAKPLFTYNSYYAVSHPTTIPNYLGSYDFAVLYNEAYHNENPDLPPPYSEEDLDHYKNGPVSYEYPNEDWFRDVINNWAFEMKEYVGVTGGSKHVSYSGSFGYISMEGVIPGIRYQRYNVRTNLQADIAKWLTAGVNLSGYQEYKNENYDGSGGSLGKAVRNPPNVPAYNPDGSYSYHTPYTNPFAAIENDGFREKNWKEAFVIFNLELKPVKGLSVKGVYSGKFKDSHMKYYKAYYEYCNADATQCWNSGDRRLDEQFNQNQQYTYQLLANYDIDFKEVQNMHFLFGFEQFEENSDNVSAWRIGYTTDLLYTLNNGDPAQQYNSGGGSSWARRSLFGRVTYNYGGKYLGEVNMRYDGTSWFAEENRWGFFPSISLGWRISEEKFMENASNVNNLKLRLGFGSTGNNEVGGAYFESQATYGIGGTYILGEQYVQGAWETRYPNEELTWAIIKSKEVGLEGTFWRGLLSFDLTYYFKKTSDMILDLPVPTTLGIGAPKQNKGSLKNTGFDLMLKHSYTPGDFSYDIVFNFAYVKNTITDMAGTDQQSGRYWYGVGYPIGAFYGYKTAGFFNSQQEIDDYADLSMNPDPKPGDLKYVDTNKDGIVDADDRVVIGQNFPSYTIGFNFSAHYKNFNLDLFFQGVADIDKYYYNEASFAFYNGGKVLERHLDRWTPDHHDATYPRLTVDSPVNYETSDFWLENASYLRLKALTFSYDIPAKSLQKIKLNNVKVYFTGENLVTFTGIQDWDPEGPAETNGSYYGNVRKLTFGLNISF